MLRTARATKKSIALLCSTTSVAALTLVAACADEPYRAARVDGAPSTTTREVARPVSDAPTTKDVADDVVRDDREGVAEPIVERTPPSLRDLERLAHEDGSGVDYLSEGDALLKDGRTAEALTAFRHALHDDDSGSTWARVGMAYVAQGDMEHARPVLEMALSRDPALSEPRRVLVEDALRTGDVKAARAHADALVEHAGGRASTHYLVGKVFMKAAMWSEAVVAFQRALDLDPKNAFAHNNLGYSALQIGRTDDAIRHLEHCVSLGTVKPYMMNNLGVAYERDGRRAEAMAAYWRALELSPSYTNAAVNKARLSSTLSEEELTLAADFLDEMRRVPPGSTMAAVESGDASVAID